MTKIYTIQNDSGERGWIQIIENGTREIDEVQGYTTKFDNDAKQNYVVISEQDYRIILNCHERYAETQEEHYPEIIDMMTTALLTGTYELLT